MAGSIEPAAFGSGRTHRLIGSASWYVSVTHTMQFCSLSVHVAVCASERKAAAGGPGTHHGPHPVAGERSDDAAALLPPAASLRHARARGAPRCDRTKRRDTAKYAHGSLLHDDCLPRGREGGVGGPAGHRGRLLMLEATVSVTHRAVTSQGCGVNGSGSRSDSAIRPSWRLKLSARGAPAQVNSAREHPVFAGVLGTF